MKSVKVEGFIDDLFDMFKEPEFPADSGVKTMERLLKPHTVEDLYQGVLIRLRTAGNNQVVRQHIMPEFFPDDGKDSTLPDTISPKLIAKYGDKLEDVIVEFCSQDAIDIIHRVQAKYKEAGKSKDSISGDQYFGTILQQVHKGQYDIIDNLVAVYKEFTDQAKKKEWQVDPENTKKAKSDKAKTNKGSFNNLIKEVEKRTDGKWSSEDIASFLSNETYMPIIAAAIAREINKAKPR